MVNLKFFVVLIVVLVFIVYYTVYNKEGFNRPRPTTARSILINPIPEKFNPVLQFLDTQVVPTLEKSINEVLSKPITVSKKCKGVLLNSLNVGKCFDLKKSGYWNGGSEFFETIGKTACYAACHTLNAPRWTCCKLPGFLDCGSCPTTICKKKCAKGLISWSAGLDSLKGFNGIKFTSVEFLDAAKTGKELSVNLRVKGESLNSVTLGVHAGIGGLLSLVPGLAGIPTSSDGSANINKIYVTTEVNVIFGCVKEKDGVENLICRAVKLSNLIIVIKGDLSVSLNDWSYISKLSKISSKLVNKVTGGLNSLLTELGSKYLKNVLTKVIEDSLSSVVKQVKIPFACDVL